MLFMQEKEKTERDASFMINTLLQLQEPSLNEQMKSAVERPNT
jgi:hypothetical protein